MAESSAAAPTGGSGTPPRILPWLVMHTVGRLGIFALATLGLWAVGLDFWSGLLFGLLLSMPLAYLMLRRSRERLTEAFAARSLARRAAKEELRTRLGGTGTE